MGKVEPAPGAEAGAGSGFWTKPCGCGWIAAELKAQPAAGAEVGAESEAWARIGARVGAGARAENATAGKGTHTDTQTPSHTGIQTPRHPDAHIHKRV